MPLSDSSRLRRPNIVLLLCDDMGFSDIGCFGSEIRTPHLDGLARRGIRFTQMYNCGRCCPTRASLLTGLYPHQAGVGDMTQDRGDGAYQGFLNDRCVTLAEPLRAAGYRTLITGKWHVGGSWPRRPGPAWRVHDPRKPLPPDRGFDDWYGIPTGGSYFHPSPLMRNHDFIEAEEDFYTTDSYTTAALGMIDRAVADGMPFFLHVCYNAPHWPLHARAEDIARYRRTYAKGWDHARIARHEELKGLGVLSPRWDISPRDADAPPWQSAGNQDWQDARMAVYAAQVDRVDQNVGRILDKLRERGVADNTLVLFLSDNGGSAEFLRENGRKEAELPFTRDGREVRVGNVEGLEPGGPETFQSYGLPWANVSNAPFRLFKHWVHEGGIATPLIAHWPAGIPGAGALVHEPAHVVDLVATCLDVAGCEYPRTFDGRDILPIEGQSFARVFRGDSWRREGPIFWEHEGNRAVRSGRWKLVSQYEPGRWELYDMTADRTELDDLADRNAAKVTELAAAYDDWAARCGVLPWQQVRSRQAR